MRSFQPARLGKVWSTYVPFDTLAPPMTRSTSVVNVVAPEIVGIVLSPAQLDLTPGQSAQVQATGTYSDGSTQDITNASATAWSTGASAVATISAQGRVTGVAQGVDEVHARKALAAVQAGEELRHHERAAQTAG